MQFSLGCVDGETYSSQYVSDEEIQELIDEADGSLDLGTGIWAGEFIATTVDDFCEMALAICDKLFEEESVGSMTLETKDGPRKFRADKIVWYQVYRERAPLNSNNYFDRIPQ